LKKIKQVPKGVDHTSTDYQGRLFHFFYRHVIDCPARQYINCNSITFTYLESYSVVSGIIERMNGRKNALKTVALNFRDQQKLLFSFWACAALEVDIVLVPEMQLEDRSLPGGEPVWQADLILSDFMEGPGCLDVEIVKGNPTIPYENSRRHSAEHRDIYFFSSGTTGRSKFIRTSYFQLVEAIDCVEKYDMMPYTQDQAVLLTVPLFHSYGLSAMIEYTNGRSHLFIPKLKDHISPLQSLFERQVASQITAIEGVPFFYKQVITVWERLSLPGLSHIGMGGDQVAPDLLHALDGKTGKLSFSIRYGVTEIPSVIGINYFTAAEDPCIRSLGKILPIYRPVLLNAISSEHSTQGELAVECELYPGQKDLVQTHDTVQYKNGAYIFIGRDIFIKYRGYKINPAEVENELNKHPHIQDCRVHLANDVLTADIVLPDEIQLIPGDIRGFLSTRLNAYLIPSRFIRVNTIARTRTGKIIRA
jgi:acyl-coenzyme A synthetase/AMP-(fatty) acid ligase